MLYKCNYRYFYFTLSYSSIKASNSFVASKYATLIRKVLIWKINASVGFLA